MRQYPEILEHYGSVDENGRLSSPVGRLELLRTQHLALRYLPEAPAIVYDVGGGTGHYAFWLAGLGYESHLIDLVPKHIDQARERSSSGHGSITSASVGDARDLDVAGGVADAVLLLGPLYHLPEPQDRMACWREAARILRPGGVVLAAIISRFASLLDGLNRDLVADATFRDILDQDLRTGVHVNRTGNPEYFTTAFLQRPADAASECRRAGLSVERLAGIEGPAWLLADLGARMADEARRAHLLDLLERVEDEDSLIGVSAHVLVVARKARAGYA